jgi:hypothetical protein
MYGISRAAFERPRDEAPAPRELAVYVVPESVSGSGGVRERDSVRESAREKEREGERVCLQEREREGEYETT